jgi:hypothetical protein
VYGGATIIKNGIGTFKSARDGSRWC